MDLAEVAPLNGFLLIDKPTGITSFDAIRQLNRRFSIQKTSKKIGHGGTLDPNASGLLVVAIGKATRLLRYFLGSDKRYTATVTFGASTTTDDIEGEVIQTAPFEHITRASLDTALDAFRGRISQIPPRFSALHIDGRRAYDLARNGEEFEMPSREVEIYEIAVLSCALPGDPTIELDVACSGGTYIRSIARDLGVALHSQAYLKALRRTRSCHFGIEQAKTLDFILKQDDIRPFMRPCAEAVAHFPSINLSRTQAYKLLNGQPVNLNTAEDGIYAIFERESGLLISILERKHHHNDFLRLYPASDFQP
ncbi:MAG: tRNA pseudouridine(55) synthase TruB [Proteobacteria bacterium]|nr:tRNA pseudouridine(55) synthase TruB [Pseudomonadota bacterium]